MIVYHLTCHQRDHPWSFCPIYPDEICLAGLIHKSRTSLEDYISLIFGSESVIFFSSFPVQGLVKSYISVKKGSSLWQGCKQSLMHTECTICLQSTHWSLARIWPITAQDMAPLVQDVPPSLLLELWLTVIKFEIKVIEFSPLRDFGSHLRCHFGFSCYIKRHRHFLMVLMHSLPPNPRDGGQDHQIW